jgi:hypothetical protein
MTTASSLEVNAIFTAAINDARDWLMTDNGDDARLTADMESTLELFDACIEDSHIQGGVKELRSFSADWASNDEGGFKALAEIADLIDSKFETDDDVGAILDYNSHVQGGWTVVIGWESGVTTTESVNRLRDWGVI